MNYRSLQMNYRSLQMNKRYLQTSQHIPIRYSIEKVRKEGQNRFLMARPFDSEEGGLQILSGQGGGEEFAQVVLKCWFKREAEDNFPRDFKILLCRLPVCVYSIYVNGVFEFHLIINIYIKYNSI